MASVEQPPKKRKLYEPLPQSPPSSPAPAPAPASASEARPPSPQTVATPSTPPLSSEEILAKRRNKDEIRSVYEGYKRIKLRLLQKDAPSVSDLEQSYLALITSSREVDGKVPKQRKQLTYELLWETLEQKDVHMTYIQAIQDINRTTSRLSRTPYLFNLVLDVLTRDIQKIIPNYMLLEAINFKLEHWSQTFERKGFQLSWSKIEYLHCDFSKRQEEYDLEVKIGENVIPHVSKFKYLRSIMQNDGEVNKDVT
ncbi:hypothetical protein CR513_05327, partial [Mucuna pruriens]